MAQEIRKQIAAAVNDVKGIPALSMVTANDTEIFDKT